MKVKTIRGVAVKAMDDAGHGVARIAVLSTVDSDGDTYSAGAFGEQWASIQPAHDWGSVMLGKARVYEEGDEALAELHFNLETEAGKEWHSALKFDLDGCCEGAPAIQEWSYGFGILDAAQETRDGERVRVLKQLDVIEVSPVLRGAGVGTATLALKHGQPFEDQAKAVAEALRSVTARTKAAIGGELEPEQLAQMVDMKRALDVLKESAVELEALVLDAAGDPSEADRLFATFEAFRSRKWLAGELG